ncbi:hypothetical protein [Isobaculum melis]|uniref:Ethanolamine utilization protein n=1 Tax=Isobaculum melis TaxID=142588 RepID=A0A1H9U4S9_9LACT|nr:hypothetical protein [Isobaculum melis]SES04379.1 ethanolamine utilization protein [Isobaculum melis]
MSQIDELVQKVMEAVLVRLSNEAQLKLKLIGTSDSNVLSLISKLPTATLTDCTIEEADVLFMTQLSVEQMGRIANGCPQTPEENALLKHFLKGKKVMVLQEGIEFYHYRQSASYALRQKFEEFELQWCRYGAEVVSKKEATWQLPRSQNQQTAEVVGTKKVWTEAKLKELNLATGAHFKLEKNALLTALAKDYLQEKNIHWT